MDDLKTCPFCCGRVSFAYNAELIPYGIKCANCHFVLSFTRIKLGRNETFGELQARMAEVWNRRAD